MDFMAISGEKRPNSAGAPKLCNSASMRDPHCEVMLSGRTSHTRVESIVFRWEALPTLRYFPNDTKMALGMTVLELHWILQVFCVRQEDGGMVNRGS